MRSQKLGVRRRNLKRKAGMVEILEETECARWDGAVKSDGKSHKAIL